MPLSDEQKLGIDVKLPIEAWEYEPLDEHLAALFRLIYWTGYEDGIKSRTRSRRTAA